MICTIYKSSLDGTGDIIIVLPVDSVEGRRLTCYRGGGYLEIWISGYLEMFTQNVKNKAIRVSMHRLYYIYQKAAIYNLTTLCLNGRLPCFEFMDVIMGDVAPPLQN